jgi:uncharacterized membrane protein YheB (UPF0754 family)
MLNSDVKTRHEQHTEYQLHSNIQIKLLEEALIIKENELAACQLNLKVLQESLQKSVVVIKTFEELLASTHSEINLSEKQIDDAISRLLKENARLKSSNMLWLNRAIKLELELLIANENTEKVTAELQNSTEKVCTLEDNLTNCQCR